MIISLSDLSEMSSQGLGVSDWLCIEQGLVDRFAELGGDHQWIHTDPERARQSAFGGTIVHGYLILALTPQLMDQVFTVSDSKMAVNRGFDKIRFVSPLKVGSQLRLNVAVKSVNAGVDYTDVTFLLSYETTDCEKPVCVAELLKRWY